MGIFSKKKDGGGHPIANEVKYDPKDPPLNDGNFFSNKRIMEERPFGAGEIIEINNDLDGECDNRFTPNIFGRWSDVYGAFSGTYNLIKAPNEIKRHEQGMKHLLFIIGRFALLKVHENKWLLGNYTIDNSDEYGRIKTGSFIPWNYVKREENNQEQITINDSNVHLIATMQLGDFGIPPFIVVGYFINFRNMLYQFKNVNLRMATIHKIIGLKAGGQKAMTKFLKDLFNLNTQKFPAPIQIMNLSMDEESGDISFNFTDLKNQIDFEVIYKGNEINLDIDAITKELFRVAGLRYDTSASSGTYQDRPSKAQTSQASVYFDAREQQILNNFWQFEYDMKEKFNIELKWDVIYNMNKIKECEQEMEKEEDDPKNI